jgi:putative transcriptional regulator
MNDLLAPGFLIAVPHLLDPNFRQSVVLLLQQSDQGAMGVVINHESSLLLKDLCRDHDIVYAGDPEKRVRKGGPVHPEQGLVLYGAEHRDPEGQHVLDGLHVSASRGTLSRLCHEGRSRFQCYSGYAGWGPGQLEQEISEGAWILCPVMERTVLEADPASVWSATLHAMGIDPAALVPGGGEGLS